jgi:hypothetical protein
MNAHQFEEARRRVVESERLVAGWRDLIARMEADDRNATIARDILKTFENDLDANTRDLGQHANDAMAADPRSCRAQAIRCAKRAAEAKSPRLAKRLGDLAASWVKLACELERARTLRDELDDDVFGTR